MSVSCGNWATGVCGGGFLDCGEPAPERVAGSWVLVMGDWGSVGGGGVQDCDPAPQGETLAHETGHDPDRDSCPAFINYFNVL